MEKDCFDTELFIDEIEKRQAIWDMSSADYSNRNKKRSAWEELVVIFGENDDSEEKKKNLGLLLQKKWKGLRDTFVQELKKNKNLPSGSGAAPYSKYLYFQRLMFLEGSVSNKPTESNITITTNSSEAYDDIDDVGRPPPNQPKEFRKKKMSPADTAFLNVIKQQITSKSQTMKQDDDKLFCLSLYKELLKVPEQNRIGVKIEMMACLQRAQQQFSSNISAVNDRQTLLMRSAPDPHKPSVNYQILQPIRKVPYDQMEYDPTCPSITPVAKTPRYANNVSQADFTAEEMSPNNIYSPASISSQDSDYLELFQNRQ